jgi:hypothetical protein
MIALDSATLRSLLERTGDDPVLTLYLPVDPSHPDNQRARGTRTWEVRLRDQLRDVAAGVPADREARQRWEAVSAQAEQFLSFYEPGAGTLVLLVGPDEVIELELPVVLEQSAGYGHPQVAGLVRAMSDHRLYVTVLVDQQSVRAVSGYLGFVSDVAHLELSGAWGMPGATRSGHQFRFEARREEYQGRFHADVAEQIDRFLVDDPEVERLVLGGTATEAHGVARALSARSHAALVGVVPMPVGSTDAEITARLDPHAQAFEEQQDLEQLAALGAADAAGRAVRGLDATASALEQFLARDVLLSAHLAPGEDVERICRGAVLSGADVRVLHAAAATALDEQGGAAARLYYAVPTETLAAGED